jgi:phage shock protein PspC (stress-responsive transcriptional regulator)/tetrahydromethanopterin S-methyltransferase subunit G
MNKTVNINLGGIVFHIDEEAFLKLSNYLDAIKRSLNNTAGQDEIIKDIELRIAELISAKHSSEKQVIVMSELDEVIAVMGQPEDYRIEGDTNDADQPKTENGNSSAKTKTKKLYRDKDDAMIGGVLSGLGYYFGIERVYLRLILLVALLFYGFGFLTYIILWIVIPEAKTTSEKLEMKGEPVNISSIEKKVREEFNNVSDKIKNKDYDSLGNQLKSNASKVGLTLSEVIHNVIKLIGKIAGIILVVFSVLFLVGITFVSFTMINTTFNELPWTNYILAGNLAEYPTWIFGLLFWFALGIPTFFVTLLGFKLISPRSNSIGNQAKYTLIILCIVAIISLFYVGIEQFSEFKMAGKSIQKDALPITDKDTLQISFQHDESFGSDESEDTFLVTEDAQNRAVIYSNNIRFNVYKSADSTTYIEIVRKARGKKATEARNSAENINYSYSFSNNNLVLNDFLLTDVKNKFRNQEVIINLYVPEGLHFKTDSSVQEHDDSDNTFFNLHYSSDEYLYRVDSQKVVCTNCPPGENDDNDVNGGISINVDEDSTSTEVSINEAGVRVNQRKNK